MSGDFSAITVYPPQPPSLSGLPEQEAHHHPLPSGQALETSRLAPGLAPGDRPLEVARSRTYPPPDYPKGSVRAEHADLLVTYMKDRIKEDAGFNEFMELMDRAKRKLVNADIMKIVRFLKAICDRYNDQYVYPFVRSAVPLALVF